MDRRFLPEYALGVALAVILLIAILVSMGVGQ